LIIIDMEDVLLPSIILSENNNKVTIQCRQPNGNNDPTAAWTLTSRNPEWCRFSFSPDTDFANALGSISGTGSQTLYLIVTNNTGTAPRSTTIYIGDWPSDITAHIMQQGNPGNITINDGAGEPPKDAITYVGAFWRANQTGERLIRINVSANSANWGAWTASVMWMDQHWKNDGGIVLSNSKSSDPNIYTNIPGNAEYFPVLGNETVITGDVVNGYIAFRIGLKKPYTPTTARPARYAVILLSYANNSKHQKIFIRQGHDADYLIRNSDPVITHTGNGVNNGGLSVRTKCKKFSPYNITDGQKFFNRDIGINGGSFVDYPTQAGAYFTWVHNPSALETYNRMRWAWRPYNIKAGATWWGISTYDFWNTLGAVNETSPPGFRRPNDGSISSREAGTNISNSEMRQSLFSRPRTNWNHSVDDVSNSVSGYYADGFFDRRPIVSSENGVANSTVAVATADVAYVGRLFFNPFEYSESYNASLFFPYAGHRKYEHNLYGGDLAFTGNMGEYWTSTVDDYSTSLSASGLRIRPPIPNSNPSLNYLGGAALWRSGSFGWGMTIRPVLDE